MFCKFCGAEIPNDSAQCPNCGEAVKTIVPVKEGTSMVPAHECDAPHHHHHRKKGLVVPIIILLIAASGWLYILSTNSIEGMMAWFTSSKDINSSLNSDYIYHNNSAEELAGNIILIVIMALFTILGVIGLTMLIRRLIRKFAPRKPR